MGKGIRKDLTWYPTRTTMTTAVQTRQLLHQPVPTFYEECISSKVVSAPLDDRLREAIMFDKAPSNHIQIVLRRVHEIETTVSAVS